MASGIEVAGIVLATLPLLVKKIDDYAEGLATLKSFRTRTYRRDMDLYAATLGTQSAILTNSITMLIEDVLDQDLEAPSQSSAHHGLWLSTIQKTKAEHRLRQCLAHDYEVFVANVKALSNMLEELSGRLTLNLHGQSKVSHQDQSRLLVEVKKFKDIFSKPVYEALLSRIESTNSTLRTLVDDALRRDHHRRTRRGQTRSLSHHQAVRKYAKTLRNAVLNQKHWRCGSRHKHRVEFVLRKMGPAKSAHGGDQRIAFYLAILLSDPDNSGSGYCTWKGHVVEAIPITVPGNNVTNSISRPIPSPPCSTTITSNTSTKLTQASAKRKVKFAVATMVDTSVPMPMPMPETGPHIKLPPAQQFLQDLCATIHQKSNPPSPPDTTEKVALIEGVQSEHYHNLRVIQTMELPETTPSIADALETASKASLWTVKPDSLYIWRNRLHLAALIATHFIGIHDNWLPPTWKLAEMALTQPDVPLPNDYAGPDCCIPIEIPGCFARSNDGPPRSSPLIQNRTLFRLGLALVELAACQSLTSLRLPEDADADDDVTSLKTASRLLDNIALQYGDRYGGVVRRCLFWNGSRTECLDDENFQRAVHDEIVLPLLDDYSTAQGAYQK